MSIFSRTGAALLLALSIPVTAAHADALTEHPGYWLGQLVVPKGDGPQLGVEIFKRADGTPSAAFAVPAHGVYNVPAKITAGADGSLNLDLSAALLKLTWAKDHFDGVFTQGSFTAPVQLTSVAQFPHRARPQTPKPPFPYRNETLAIASTDGVTLGATLSLPEERGHPKAVILVGGSGATDRDEAGAGHEPFAVLADHLARQGVAVLRYDKRGVSRSTGDYSSNTSAQLVDDVVSIVHALKARGQFAEIGLLGHSEGSAVAAAAAARLGGDVGFVVSLGGVGMYGRDMILLQDRIAARDHGATPEEVERLAAYTRKFYDIVIAEPDSERRVAALKAFQAGLSPEERALIEERQMNQGTLSLSVAALPAERGWLMDDPTGDWRKVRCPVLALNGALDHQVPPGPNLAGIVAALKAGGNNRVEWAELAGLNHLFQTAKTGKEDEYADIDETLAPMALQRISDFIARVD